MTTLKIELFGLFNSMYMLLVFYLLAPRRIYKEKGLSTGYLVNVLLCGVVCMSLNIRIGVQDVLE